MRNDFLFVPFDLTVFYRHSPDYHYRERTLERMIQTQPEPFNLVDEIICQDGTTQKFRFNSDGVQTQVEVW